MKPDSERYRHHLAEFDLSDERKNDLVQAVWAVMEGFADRAFGLHPAQQVIGPSSGTEFPNVSRNGIQSPRLSDRFTVQANHKTLLKEPNSKGD